MYLFLDATEKLFTLTLYPLRYYITVYNCSFKVKYMYFCPLNFKSGLGRLIFRFRFQGAFPIHFEGTRVHTNFCINIHDLNTQTQTRK